MEDIFDKMGEYLALAVATIHYATPKDKLETLLLFGRVMKGNTGIHVVKQARKV